MTQKKDDSNLTLHHMTVAHLRDALRPRLLDRGQEALEERHLTSAHLQEALQPANQTPPASSQQQTGSAPASGASGQSDKK